MGGDHIRPVAARWIESEVVLEVRLPAAAFWILGDGARDIGGIVQRTRSRVEALAIERALVEGFEVLRPADQAEP